MEHITFVKKFEKFHADLNDHYISSVKIEVRKDEGFGNRSLSFVEVV